MSNRRMDVQSINVFVYGDETHVHAIGWRMYESAGTYEEQVAFLRSAALHDHRIAARRNLDEPILRRKFEAFDRLNPFIDTLAEKGLLQEHDVYCVTHIVNGEVRIDGTRDETSNESIPDYLTVYRSERGFDFPKLIQDDYFEAIHLLWNNGNYISCLKLVFSAIDTFGFVEYGPACGKCFTKWLDKYCDLGSVGVTSDELWELRNSLIHMTNLDSRKVHSGKIHQLRPKFVHPDRELTSFEDDMKVLHAARFVVRVLPKGIEAWLQSYNQDRSKFPEFVERYDTVVSEARLMTRGST